MESRETGFPHIWQGELVSRDAACFNYPVPSAPDAGIALVRKPAKENTGFFKELLMKRHIALLLIVLFSAAALTACNTVKGVGKDVQKAGEKLEDASGK